MEIKGRIFKVMDIESGQGKSGEWKKQNFCIETDGKYPKKVCIQLFGKDKIEKYDLRIGAEVTVSIEIESKEYNNKWYTQISAWKIEGLGERKVEQRTETKKEDFPAMGGSSDDLPF